MRIESVEVSHFRRLVGPIRVDLAAGLNVVHGPNEIGKSTLAEAIWCAMAIGTKGNAGPIKALKTHNSTEKPKVTLTLHDGDKSFEITKSYGSGGATNLTIRENDKIIDELTQEAAEEKLQELLRLGPSARGGISGDARGSFVLSWVRQGDSGMQPGECLNEPSRSSIQAHLAKITGEALVGEQGARIHAAANREFGRFFVKDGGEKSSADAPLANARTAFATAKDTLEHLLGQVDAHGTLVEQQRNSREKLATARGQIPQVEANFAEAKKRFAELDRIANERAHRELARKTAASDRETLIANRAGRKRLRDEEAQQVELAEQLRKEVEDLEARAKPLAQDLDERQAAVTSKRTELTQLTEARAHSGALAKLATELASVARLEARYEKARKAESELVKAKVRRDAASVSEDDLQRLESLDREAREHRIKLEAAAANIAVTRRGDLELRIDGVAVDAPLGETVDRTITTSTSIEVGELLTVTVRPGGTDLSELETAAEQAENELADALRDLGADSIATARQMAAQRQQADQDVTNHEQAIELYAEEGVPELGQLLEATQATAGVGREKLEEAGVDVGPALVTDEAAHEALDGAVQAAEDDERGAREDLEKLVEAVATLNAEASDIKVKLATATTNRKNAEDKTFELREALKAEITREGEDDALDAAIGEAAIRAEAAAREVEKIDEQLAAGALEGAKKDLDDSERAVETKKSEIAALDVRIEGLAGQLRETKMVGIHEKIAEAEETKADAERGLTRVEAEANAARLLFQTLSKHKDETERRFRAPLEEGIQALVRLLWPDAKITLDEHFHIASIERPNRPGRDEFGVLSAGASEQLGLVARLAMAQILAKGQPLVVLLDDSLVVTDDDRFRDMARVINRVADDVQIIFLTCHWSRQSELGLSPHNVVDMEDLVAALAASA